MPSEKALGVRGKGIFVRGKKRKARAEVRKLEVTGFLREEQGETGGHGIT
jgi:hypothetical protein